MTEDTLDRLLAAVEQHYRSPNSSRLLLSSFGQKNKALVAELKAEFGSLMAAVRAAGDERIQFIDTTPGREAIAPASMAANLRKRFEENSASEGQDASYFDILPQSVQLTFCVRTDASEIIAIDTLPPFRYSKVTVPDLIRPTQRIVPDKYRRPGLSLRSASTTERAALWRQFLAWAEDTGVDPATFRSRSTSTALARLINAQQPDVVARLVIPADIAQILLKHS